MPRRRRIFVLPIINEMKLQVAVAVLAVFLGLLYTVDKPDDNIVRSIHHSSSENIQIFYIFFHL
jgi:hypothetical protein